jgi:hypothetical protein
MVFYWENGAAGATRTPDLVLRQHAVLTELVSLFSVSDWLSRQIKA